MGRMACRKRTKAQRLIGVSQVTRSQHQPCIHPLSSRPGPNEAPGIGSICMALGISRVITAIALGSGLVMALPHGVAAQEPPEEAIFCARGTDSDISPLVGTPELEAILVGGNVSLEAEVPDGATCFRISRRPSDRNPLVFEWDATGVSGWHSFVDEAVPSSGDYCYELVVGSPAGRSAGVERCVTVPDSVAPTPTATPTLPATPVGPSSPGPGEQPASPSPGAPDTGSSETAPDGLRYGRSVVGGFALLVLVVLLAHFVVAKRRPL